MTVLGRTLNLTASKPRIGFIGLGAMGRGMARNLAAKGFPLTVVGHRNRAPVDDSLVLPQLVANVEMNAGLARPDFSQLQPKKVRVWNGGKRISGPLQPLRIDFVSAHPR